MRLGNFNLRRGWLFVALLMLVSSGLESLAQGSQVPAPRTPPKKELKSVDELVRYAKIVIQRTQGKNPPYMGIPGVGGVEGVNRVLLAANTDVDRWVLQAFEKALHELGVEDVTTVIVPRRTSRPEESIARGRSDAALFSESGNSWVEGAAREADRILNFGVGALSSLDPDVGRKYGQYLSEARKYAINVVRMPFYTRHQLASPYVDYPDELFIAIGTKVWEKFRKAKKWVLTDEWGTHLEWTLDEKHWRDMPATRGNDSNEIPNSDLVHLNVRPVLNKDPDMKGVIVTRALSGALIPEIRIYIDKAAVTHVEAGGAAGESFRAVLERYKNIQFPGFPSPGVGNVEEVALGVHPKAKPDEGPEYLGFSEVRRRSGTIHIGLGATRNPETRDVLMKGTSGLPRGQHRDWQIYFPTLILDGEVFVEKGHLTVLDDPEIRRLASKFGDPDQLLSEDWIPPLDFGLPGS